MEHTRPRTAPIEAPVPVDLESRELRHRLLDAGRAVFARVGYAAATVDEVIAEAGTSRATFYRYIALARQDVGGIAR